MDFSNVHIEQIYYTSAVIAAAVAGVFSVVSQVLGQLTSQHMAQKARRSELLFKEAIEMAKERRRVCTELAKDTNSTLTLIDDVDQTAAYYKLLEAIFDNGRLPEEHEAKVKRQFDAIEQARAAGITDDGRLNRIAHAAKRAAN
jgi:hypothetical protein